MLVAPTLAGCADASDPSDESSGHSGENRVSDDPRGWTPGTAVEANYIGTWFPATYEGMAGPDRYRITWGSDPSGPSGSDEVFGYAIRDLDGNPPVPAGVPDEGAIPDPAGWIRGMEVEASKFGTWYPATYEGVNLQGLFEITWQDGPTGSEDVAAYRIRDLDGNPPPIPFGGLGSTPLGSIPDGVYQCYTSGVAGGQDEGQVGGSTYVGSLSVDGEQFTSASGDAGTLVVGDDGEVSLDGGGYEPVEAAIAVRELSGATALHLDFGDVGTQRCALS
jgi:hypothetical protein